LISKILVATDFSENANRAIDFAADLSEKLRASVTIINVIPNIVPFGMSGAEIAIVRGENYLSDIKRINEGKIASIINNIKLKNSSIIISIVIFGNPVQEILLKAEDFDILVIGHRGESKLLDSFMGTTSERIIHKAKLPVIVVP
jgi:nucleotide-binding universal stress UspA family protein